MGKHNNQVPNQHFKKKWQINVTTWFNQPARKVRRRTGATSSHRAQPELLVLPDLLCSYFSCFEKVEHVVVCFAARAKKAAKVFPRPAAGALRPVVHAQTVKYNNKLRLGRGFTLEELKVRRNTALQYTQLWSRCPSPIGTQ
jgi:large subunit ribosomal protein L13e